VGELARSQGAAELARCPQQAEQAVVGAEPDLARSRRQASRRSHRRGRFKNISARAVRVEDSRQVAWPKRPCCSASAAFGDPDLRGFGSSWTPGHKHAAAVPERGY